MKIAAVYNPGWKEYYQWLVRALGKSHRVDILVASSDESPDLAEIFSNSVILPASSKLEFSAEVHSFLMHHSYHAVESFLEGYPLFIEGVAGGTPTIIRCDERIGSKTNFRVSRQTMWTEKVLENKALMSACCAAVSQRSVFNRLTKTMEYVEYLPLTTRSRAVYDGDREGIVVVCSEIDAYLSQFIIDFGSTDYFTPERLAEDSGFDSRCSRAKAVVFEKSTVSFDRVCRAAQAGTPIIFMGAVEGIFEDWPIFYAREGEDLRSILRKLSEMKNLRMRDFFQRFEEKRLVNEYETLYENAIEIAMRCGRSRGW